MSYFSPTRADRAVRFYHSLKLTEGEWAGKPFRLLPYQEHDIVRPVFGTLRHDAQGNETPYRQYHIVYVEVPKKSGKSPFGAATAWYLLTADGEKSPLIAICATDIKQADIIFKHAKRIRKQSAALTKRSKTIDSRKRIITPATEGVLEVVSGEAYNKSGPSMSGVIFDEMHEQKTRELWDIMTEFTGDARTQQLIMIFTTAGYDRTSICYELHKYALQVRDGIIDDPTFLPVIYSAPDDADWTDRKVWIKCNPALRHKDSPNGIIDIEKVEVACKKAQQDTAKENHFRRFRLCQWVKQHTRWIKQEYWDACATAPDLEYLRGRRCCAGLDLASTRDIAAFVLVFPPDESDDTGTFDVLAYFWVPAETAKERVKAVAQYEDWIAQGHMIETDGATTSYANIRTMINALQEQFEIAEIAFDPHEATQIVQDLTDDGFEMVRFSQTFGYMSPACKGLGKLILEGKIRHGGDPVLSWMFDNIAIGQGPNDQIKFDKQKSTEKIDGMVALAMACNRAILHKPPPKSAYVMVV